MPSLCFVSGLLWSSSISDLRVYSRGRSPFALSLPLLVSSYRVFYCALLSCRASLARTLLVSSIASLYQSHSFAISTMISIPIPTLHPLSLPQSDLEYVLSLSLSLSLSLFLCLFGESLLKSQEISNCKSSGFVALVNHCHRRPCVRPSAIFPVAFLRAPCRARNCGCARAIILVVAPLASSSLSSSWFSL